MVIALPSGHASAEGSCSLPVAVNVYDIDSGQSTYLSQSVLASNETVNGESIDTRSTPGGQVSSGTVVVNCGITIADVLGDAGLDRSSANYVGFPQDGSGTSSVQGYWGTLTQSEIWSPGSRFTSGQSPVIWDSGDLIEYARPLLAGDTSDVNVAPLGQVNTDGSSALQIYVGSGTLLSVTDSVSYKRKTKSGDAVLNTPVTFKASASPDSSSPTYNWTFSDGTTAQGKTVTHEFSQQGDYTANLIATSSDGSGGAAEPLSVGVGDLPKTPSGGGPTPTSGSSGSPNPGHSGGSHSPSPNPGHGSTSPSPTPTPTPSDSVPHINLPPLDITEPAGTFSALPPVIAPTTSPIPIGTQGVLVEGRIINDADASPSGSASSTQAQGSATTRPLSGRRTAFLVLAGIAVIMLLFAAGAARESRGFGRRKGVRGPQ